MSTDNRARLKQWLQTGEASIQSLTFPQRELWESSPVAVDDVSHHICCLIEVRGLVTERDCRAATQRVVDRQEALRLSFLPGKNGTVQFIRRKSEANFELRDLSAASVQKERVEELATEIFSAPFDLVRGPLYRAVDVRLASDCHWLVFTIHHAIADGWTLGVFVKDLFAAYIQIMMGSDEPLPPVPLTYSEWGREERALWQPTKLENHSAIWKQKLRGARKFWNAPISPGVPRRRVTRLSENLAAQVRALAKGAGVTLFSTLLGAFHVAFAKWSGETDIIVGTPVANRARKSVHETMGYCSGIVPIRCHLDRLLPFCEHLRFVQELTLEAFDRAIPFVELVRALDEPTGNGLNPVFDVRFALQNHPMPEVTLPTLSARLTMRSTGTPRFQLGCEITEIRDGLEVVWLFRDELFSSTEIETLEHLFEETVTVVCRSSERRIHNVLA